MFAVALLPIVLGVVVCWGGLLGSRSALTRARGVGVRTAATLRSDDAFRLANRIAATPTMVGGAVGIAGGAAGLTMPSSGGLIVAVAIGLVGMFALVAGGGVLGHRAAETVPAPEGSSGACGTCSGAACLAGTMSTSCRPEQASAGAGPVEQ